ncbi:hypothetical protein BDV25DRAFT_152337 [Aspergillus avenaceus]|uniref:Integral membrane protein n=1 Tax=Aspergillus avenaceus TaxID=36643 RepID=A0A5N6TZ04_ASPAV|nr:hypothetical protein BDV25DRAFT_152337 [Aspergillus avenaceus]
MGLFNRKQRLSLITFAVFYFSLFFFCRSNSARDPGSFFFQPREGYRPSYTLQRIHESLNFLSRFNQTAAPSELSAHRNDPSVQHADICIGIVTVKRPLQQKIETTVASIVDNLSQAQRSTLAIHVLFAQTTPSTHPSYTQPWVSNALDRALTYDHFNDTDISYLRRLERSKKFFAEKSLIDYRLSLQSCLDYTDAPYFLMLEDDVVAQRSWYLTTRQAIDRIETWQKRSLLSDWLYLRLFYTEKFLGWNAEHWREYFAWSLLVVVAVASLALSTRRVTRSTHDLLSNSFLLVLCFLCVPLLILLYFASGRVTVQQPMKPGIHFMNRHGCCSQALLFPRDQISRVMTYLQKMEDQSKPKPVDTTLERFANEFEIDRLAISPPQMQHIGAASYKEDEKKWRKGEYPVQGAHGVWSMQFETAYESVSADGVVVDTLWP